MQRGGGGVGCKSKSNTNPREHLGSDIRLAALCEVHLAQSATQHRQLRMLNELKRNHLKLNSKLTVL